MTVNCFPFFPNTKGGYFEGIFSSRAFSRKLLQKDMEIEPRLGDLEFHISRFNIHRKLNDLERLFRHRQREKENIEAPAPEKKSLPTKAANEDYGSFPVPLGVKRPTLPEPPLILTPRLSIPISEPRVVDLISPEQKEIKPAPWLPEVRS